MGDAAQFETATGLLGDLLAQEPAPPCFFGRRRGCGVILGDRADPPVGVAMAGACL